jgi:hypothetical protein
VLGTHDVLLSHPIEDADPKTVMKTEDVVMSGTEDCNQGRIRKSLDDGFAASDAIGGSPSIVSRRAIVGHVAFFGAVMTALSRQARAQQVGSGSYSDAAIATPSASEPVGPSGKEKMRAVKIARAMRAGPAEVTREATVAEMDSQGNLATILRKGNNDWVCVPGDENKIGAPAMCVDALGMQWFKDVLARRPKPTNQAPGLCYMLCGATQHSNTDPFDTTSPAIPIGPHWMVLWPFDAKHCGLPTTVRDAGAWIMFAGTPYAYLHICGAPWAGKEYASDDEPVWTMQYMKRNPAP